MTAIKPEINLSLFGRKKNVAEDTATTEELIDSTIDVTRTMITETVDLVEAKIDRGAVRFFVAAVVGGAILIAVNTAGQILVNALDNRNH